MSEFFVLEPAEGILFGTKWAFADILPPINRENSLETCPVCGKVVRGREWLLPRRIKLSRYKSSWWGDFVWGAGFLLLVSAHFKQVYEQENLQGITKFSEPVEVLKAGTKKMADLPGDPPIYHLIDIVWNGANQDDVASEVINKHPEQIRCSFCRVGGGRLSQSGIIIETDSWTGADIFTPRGGPVRIMVSKRFKEAAEAYDLKNTWFIPAENYAYDETRPGLWYVNDK